MAKITDKEVDKQIHDGRRAKLRAQFLKYGLESFNEVQVIEFALGIAIPRIDTNPTAHRLINKFGSLNGVIDAHPNKLKEIGGIGEQAAFFLSFLKQFVTYSVNLEKPKDKIKTPGDAVILLREVMKTFTREYFVLVCLDKSGSIILQDTMAGGLDKVDINLRDITDTALRVKASAVVLAHNHLDEGFTPSDADIRLTRSLVNIFAPLGIDVMEHLIFNINGAHYSFATKGIMDVLKREYRSFAVSDDFEDMLPL